MSNTKNSGEFVGLGIDLCPSDGLTTDDSRFGSMMASAGSPPNTLYSHELRTPEANETGTQSRSNGYAGDFLGIHTGVLGMEHLDGLQRSSLNLRDLSGELAISRNDTLLSLKPSAVLLPILGENMGKENTIILEQAKNRARVDLDIALESNVCVQGGYLKGHIKVRIWKQSKKDHPVLVSGGKVRVIGFECIMNENERLAFYQASATFSEVASGLSNLYVFEPDGEGFCRAIDGIYSFPFSLHLPLSSEYGTPKGVMHSHSGASVRYIAMVSLRVKDAISGEKSIAHFYRDCSIWPRLNPSVVLAPLPRPLQVTVSGSLSMGGNNGMQLTASLYRLNWIAGQPCQVKITIINNSKKNVKNLTLGIYRSTIIFKPKVPLESLPENRSTSADIDAWQTSATKRQVAESTLVVGERGSRGHASAKGWWSGVGPGKSMTFSHFISIPPDALSIPRGTLLEVLYVLRVTISSGSLLPTDVHATLPLHIVNFLSIDPPVSSPRIPSAHLDSNLSNAKMLPVLSRPIGADSERSDTDLVGDEDSSYSDEDIRNDSEDLTQHDLGRLSLHDDTDEVVQYAVASARTEVDYVENAPRFADLYYSSLQENLDRAAEQYAQHTMDNSVSQMTKSDGTRGWDNKFTSRVHEKTLRRNSERPDRAQESYSAETEVGAALYDEVDTHQVSHSHQAGSYAQSEARTASHPDYGLHGDTASSKSATCIPLSDSRSGPRSFQFAESASIHEQNPAVNEVYNASVACAYDPDTTSASTASRSRSVKDKIREFEERVERANKDG